MSDTSISIHWFRRDLRLNDNHGLFKALSSGHKVIPLFIFDADILGELERDDARVSFLHDTLSEMDAHLKSIGSGLLILHGNPLDVWKKIISTYPLAEVHTNSDYEPYALKRDAEVRTLLEGKGIAFNSHKDQVIFEKSEVTKDDGLPYTVYTPYSKKWFSQFDAAMLEPYASEELEHHYHRFSKVPQMPSLADLGFNESALKVKPYHLEKERIAAYEKNRNFPAQNGTSNLSPHLRFGTISVREAFKRTHKVNHTFAKELVWREFFMQILFHYPHVVSQSFREKYDRVPWRNDEREFQAWCEGRTGYPMVDAGMRELNETGYMHNRVRMVVASFLCKHLLIDWRWGEAYFAKKLFDYELSSNNGNWQWAAGTGCDAAPYFRVFNPTSQIEKFDQYKQYIRQWVPEFESERYPEPIVEHKMARERAISTYKEAIS
jgi:deoxyribodipyrimidine photo-lyase